MPESKTIPVFTDRKGVLRVWRDAVGNYGTFGAECDLAREMGREIERLRAELQKLSMDRDETDDDLLIAKKEIERLQAELAVYRARAERQQSDLTSEPDLPSEQLTMLSYERELKKSEAQRALDKRLEEAKRKEPLL